ncbi:T9SS type A sorting domain-containing protein [Crocinitomix catalasitica]|uniref:T9SS type A sorting domain-containing protein n=1 Tax=Crocinitomix catalasitica TaxID=184607 RepID=UPI000480BB4C|nr:T9SS type A sorting domain-containing protein [Crocinitomix catalasitica]
MTKLFRIVFCLIGFSAYSQEYVAPLKYNQEILNIQPAAFTIGANIDSLVIFNIDTIELPLVDDFSVNRFEKYEPVYEGPGVSSVLYHHLMDEDEITPLPPDAIYCDSNHAHTRVINIVGEEVTVDTVYNFISESIFVNDLFEFPVVGQLRELYDECYILIDTIIDGVPDVAKDTVWYNEAPGPAFCQDSARVFTADLDNAENFWQDNDAYHNYTYAYNPWSLGVVTFDGVDKDGWPYDIGDYDSYGIADVLTSKPINLLGQTDVYLTFIYQAKGFGDAPEPEDSLLLEFWSTTEEKWISPTEWEGGLPEFISENTWDTAHVFIRPGLLTNGFKFRFKNYASLSGSLDHWHIDYVSLKADRVSEAEDFSDLAISYPVNSLLKDYTSVPWDHYKNTIGSEKMLEKAGLDVYNSDATNTIFAPGKYSVKYEGVLQGGSPFNIVNTGIPEPNYIVGINNCLFNVASEYSYDQGLGGDRASFDVQVNIASAVAGENVIRENDTTSFTQRFSNYYAYDDGSAEAAYGVLDNNTQLAYKFEAYEAGLLTGLLMHFVPTIDDLSGEIFLLTVWADDGGEPGEIIYQDDFFNTHSPEYSGAPNGYKYYTFTDDVYLPVDKIFYVGWENIDEKNLHIGLDWNNKNADKIFWSADGDNWLNSLFDASLMIRPVFSTALDYTLSNADNAPVREVINIYPNPSNAYINIDGITEPFDVQLYDLSGRLVLTAENENQINIADFNNGVYLVQIRNSFDEIIQTTKLIKN